MRTLKKTLSLVLVVAMVLGLCVVGASAYNKVEDFTDDVSKIGATYYEAVGVLTGIGVIDGMTATAFEPQGNYTREQAAKIIAYMQLGKAKADSLKCTVAPFEDVAASRWSAGYIAYCVEQGIINGMTETTFEPTGKLTGFQWAKMLLCAVGFGVKGEFTGSSWSVNTAKVAHTVDLFMGDLAGADHTAITREQAALYAFNVLTGVKKVAYSPNVTSYVYGIQGYWTVDGIGHTLATDVFDLYKVVGIVVDSEGLGAPATVVNVKGGYDTTAANLVSVKADTGLNMMYHAARIWYVAGTKANTGVFTLDLAKTETTNCPSKLPAGALTIGTTGTTGKPYQLDAVDNSAIDAGKVNVGFYYSYGTLGVRSAVNNTTVVNGEAVKNANIKTDISKINNGDPIIYLKGKSTTSDNYGWYVYAPSATKGTVVSINNAKSTITLSDGTVLAKSNLSSVHGWNNLIAGKTYTFVLDTHGHWINWVANLGVAYYTGTIRFSSAHEAWFSDAAYVAQFVNVSTGEVSEVPVTSTWAKTAKAGGYYDISDALYGTSMYYPVAVTVNNETSYGSYVLNSGSFPLKATTYKIGSVYYDPSNVTFIIATNKGSGLTVNSYVGFSALLAAYNKTGAEDTVTLKNIAMTCTTTAAGNKSATVIFAYDGIVSTTGGFLFVAKNISAENWSWTITNGVGTWAYNDDVVYLNGETFATDLVMDTKQAISRGFYTYTIGANGIYELTPLSSGAYVFDVNKMAMTTDNVNYYMTAGGKEYNITSWSVVDLRTGAGVAGGVDKIETVADLVKTNFSDYPDAKVQIAFVPSVGVIYIVDNGLLRWNVAVTSYSVYKVVGVENVPQVGDTGTVTITLKKTDNNVISDNKTDDLTFTVKVNGVEQTIVGIRNADGTGSFDLPVSGDTTVEVTNVAWVKK